MMFLIKKDHYIYSRSSQYIFGVMTVMMLIYPYPSPFSAIYSLFSIILLFLAILKLNVTHHKPCDIFIFILLIVSALPSLLFGYKFFVLQYIISIFLIYLLVKKNKVNDLFKSEFSANIFILFSVFFMFFFHESHPIESRYSIINGDPNYTSLFYFVITFVICLISDNKYKKMLSVIIMFFVLYLTDSRMTILMVVYITLANIKFISQIMKSKLTCYCIFFISLSFQIILAYSSDLIDIIGELLSFSGGELRMSHIIDSSNMKRIDAARNAVEFLKNIEHFSYGSVKYRLEAGVSTIPHHWFLLPSVTYGVIFTSVYAFILFLMIKHLNSNQRVGFSLMFISGAILGSVPIVNCLPIILFYAAGSENKGD